MTQLDDLLGDDLDVASRVATEVIPDLTAAFDRLVPLLLHGGDRSVVRRYLTFVDEAARALTDLPADHPEQHPASSVVYELLRRSGADLLWVTPSPDGLGIVAVLVDRLRGYAGGLPSVHPGVRPDIDVDRFTWIVRSIAEIEQERESGSPLRRAMTTLGLSTADVALLMGVTRQAVDKWLLVGPPLDRLSKLGAIAGIAELLRHRLRAGMPAVVVRRSAEAYGGRTMLEVIAADEHEWLRRSVEESFDLHRVA